MVINPTFDGLGGYEKFWGNYSIVKLNQKYGIIDIKGKQVIPFTYKYLTNTQSTTEFIFEKNGKYGLINNKGKVILKPEFDFNIQLANKGKIIIVSKNKRYALLKKNGKKITDYKYDYISGNFNSKIYAYKSGNKWGYINSKGKEIIKPKYSQAGKFNGKYAIVKSGKKYGIINKNAKFLLEPIYDKIYYPYSLSRHYQNKNLKKVYYLVNNNKVNVIDNHLKIITSESYDEIGDFSEGYAYVRNNNKYGFINEKGKLIIPLIYENANYFSEGLAPVLKNGKWGYIDKFNNVVINFKFTGFLAPFFEGMAVYRKRNYKSSKAYYTNDKVGYINVKGNIIIQPAYKSARRFINGVAIVKDKKFVYLINKKNNKFILKPNYDEIEIEESE